MSIVPNFTESKRIVIIDGNVPLQPQVRGCRSPSRACPQDWKVELGPLDTLHLMARLRGGFHISAGDSVTKASETWIWVSLITRELLEYEHARSGVSVFTRSGQRTQEHEQRSSLRIGHLSRG